MRKSLFIALFLFVGFDSFCQDSQFSQFYAAPMYHNPAFTGSGYAPRLILNFRNQWPALSANFTTSIVSIDHYVEKLNSGIGLMLLTDEQGSSRHKNTEVSAFYSYQVHLVDDHFLRLGVEGTYSNRGLNTNGLTFPDQFDGNGYMGIPSNDPLANLNVSSSIADYSAGLLYYNPQAFLGVSMHHISRPDVGYLDTSKVQQITATLERKLMINGGFNLPINSRTNKEATITPAFLYKQQGEFSQLDLGAYFTYDPLTIGLWYRGIPIKKNNINSANHDALVALAGFRFDNFSFGYSYDITISGLGSSSGGAHEISVAYQFDAFESEKNPYIRKRKKALSCPKF